MLDYHKILRKKVKAWLVDNNNSYYQRYQNPFGEKFTPIMCDFKGVCNFQTVEAYESGNRSIILDKDGKLIKAKGIGIPVGLSRPIYDESRIYTYQLLNDPRLCHRYILWGFMQEEEYVCEQFGAAKAKELGQNIELIGTSSFNEVYYLEMKDRVELFKKLKILKHEELINSFNNSKNKTTAYSTYYIIPSDIRVAEICLTFIFPYVTELIDPNNIKDYVEWLGSSCGHLLRSFHDAGVLHGTWLGPESTNLGILDIHSNAYMGNYLVDEDDLTMCDFDLSRPIEKDSEKNIEKWALTHIENPFYYAGNYSPYDALNQRIAKKNIFREELAKRFEESVTIGYDQAPLELERKMRKAMLNQVVRVKEIMWKLYELPKDITYQIDYIDQVILSKKIDKNMIKKIELNP